MKNNLLGNKTCLLSVYYGHQPNYLNLFLNSAKNNFNFDFHIFSDWEDIPIKSDNIFFHRLSLSEFNKLAIDKHIILKEIKNPYKLCDLKPAWPFILNEYLIEYNYSYIGYTDIDLVLGNIGVFINKDLELWPDIWTIHSEYMAGSFLLMKNTESNKTIFKFNDYYKFIFNTPTHFAFDENFLPQYKNLLINQTRVISFTDIINHLEKKGNIFTIRKRDILFESRPSLITYKDGHIFDKNLKELFGFHFLLAKKYMLWTFPSWKSLPSKFSVNKYGFYKNNPLNIYGLFIRYSYLIQIIRNLKKLDIFYIIKNNSPKVLIKSIRKQFFT